MNQTSSKGSSGAEIVAILVALGIPAGVVTAFHDFVFAHPVPSLVIGILYIVMAGSVFVLWQRLVNLWIERSVHWIDTRVQWFTSQARRKYWQYLVYQYRDFDVKGLSTQVIYTLELDQVFVELRVDPMPAHATSSDPVRLPADLATGEHAIWDYLAADALKNQHLAIIGAPGSGKTSLLKHVVLSLVTRTKRQVALFFHRLPFLLLLREVFRMLHDAPDASLTEVIEALLKRGKYSPPAGWVERQLGKGRCLVLLDGLDEVADATQRRQLAEWVQQQMRAYGNNRFVLTSRPFGL
jgi:NACHT domain